MTQPNPLIRIPFETWLVNDRASNPLYRAYSAGYMERDIQVRRLLSSGVAGNTPGFEPGITGSKPVSTTICYKKRAEDMHRRAQKAEASLERMRKLCKQQGAKIAAQRLADRQRRERVARLLPERPRVQRLANPDSP